MSELSWFRMWSDAVDNPKLRLIAFEDRWHFVALCCLKCAGIIDKLDDPNRERMIAVKLGVQPNDLAEIRRRLLEVRLVDEQMNPVGWNDRQFQSDKSTKRVQAFRERQRNVSETPPETETDTEKTPLPPEGGFADFWTAYPKKIRKAAAMRAWLRKGLNAKAGEIISHLTERVRSDAQWLAEGGKYIPHPATWLNGDGWLDEYQRASERGFVC